MRISKGFIKSSLIYTVAGALPMASAILLLPFYILYLPTDVYGALSICLAFAVFVQIVVTYSFDSSLFIHYHELKNTPEALASFISSAFLFMLGLGVAVGLVLSATGQFIFSRILPDSSISFYPYGFISVAVGICQAIFKVHSNLLQTREKPETFLVGNVIYFLVIAGVTIGGLKLYPNSLVGPLGGRLLAGILGLMWVYGRVFREFGFHFRSPWENTSASFNAYAFLYQLQQWAINYLDRFLIVFFLPLSQVGIYDFAIKCLAVIDLLLVGMNAAITPRVIQIVGKQKEKASTPEINRYYYGQLSLIMILLSVSVVAIPVGIDLFISHSGYARALPYLPYLAALYVFRSMRLYFAVQYNILKKMGRLTWISLVVSAVKIGLLLIWIPRWELYGVVASAFVAALLELAMLSFFLKRDFQFRYNRFKLLGAPMLLVAVIMIFEPLLGADYPLYVHMGYVILCGALLWFAYRNELRLLTTLKF